MDNRAELRQTTQCSTPFPQNRGLVLTRFCDGLGCVQADKAIEGRLGCCSWVVVAPGLSPVYWSR